MRYYIIIGITIIIALFIYFYPISNDYLGIYKNKVTIEYKYNDEGYKWIYDNNNVLNIKEISDSKWELKPNSNGTSIITFYYTNTDNKEDAKYSIYYKFNVKNKKIIWIEGYAKGLLDYPNPY